MNKALFKSFHVGNTDKQCFTNEVFLLITPLMTQSIMIEGKSKYFKEVLHSLKPSFTANNPIMEYANSQGDFYGFVQ